MRMLRFQPWRDATYFVTMRTLQGRFLLTPDRALNDRFVGVFGRANEKYQGVELHALVIMGNHWHALLTAESAGKLSAWMNFVAGNTARLAGEHHAWEGKFWARRYRGTVCVDRESVVRMLAYVVSHGAKEGHTKRPEAWPGVHCVDALRLGRPLVGTWFEQTGYGRAERRGQAPKRKNYETRYSLRFTIPPCMRDLGPAEFRGLVEQMRRDAIATGEAVRDGRPPLGAKRVLRQDPHAAPPSSKRAPGSMCHAASKAARKAFIVAYKNAVSAYREAIIALRAGITMFEFPDTMVCPAVSLAPPGPS